jgi:acetyltransferase-like isoleucine patch superfamily enzyme
MKKCLLASCTMRRIRRILIDLFSAGGDSVGMQPPFYCDYGSNFELGKRVFFTFDCIVLDVCKVGSDAARNRANPSTSIRTSVTTIPQSSV